MYFLKEDEILKTSGFAKMKWLNPDVVRFVLAAKKDSEKLPSKCTA